MQAGAEFVEGQAALRVVLGEGGGGRLAFGVADPQIRPGGGMDKPVVAAEPAGRDLFAVDPDQAGRAQVVQGGVERPGAERDPAAGIRR